MQITAYEALCNLGNDINSIYEKAINGDISCFDNLPDYFNDGYVRAGIIKADLQEIGDAEFNLRCNRFLVKASDLLKNEIRSIKEKYGEDRIGILVASTNSGVEEYENTKNIRHFELGNPAEFLKKYLNLRGFYATVSTACSSGLKTFSLARELLSKNICDAIIVASTDSLSKVPIYGFHSLEVLSSEPSIPFSKNRMGMNMGEACSIFIVERESKSGIKVMGIGETSDVYHPTTPDPEAKESIIAIQKALTEAKIEPKDVDYINAHGTGTLANDAMETCAISKVFGGNTPVSSTKPLTGHCLGAAAGIETALCCKILDSFDGRLYPNIYDGNYDNLLPRINLVEKGKKYSSCKICMCNSFGFGGANAIIILGKINE